MDGGAEANEELREEAIQREREWGERRAEGSANHVDLSLTVNVEEMCVSIVGDVVKGVMMGETEKMCEKMVNEIIKAAMRGEEGGRGRTKERKGAVIRRDEDNQMGGRRLLEAVM